MIDVAAAVLVENGKILIAKRAQRQRLAGKWEFPGGKIERGEDAGSCLVRELREEFDLDVEVDAFLGDSTYRYDFGTVKLVFYLCRLKGGTLNPKVHQEYRWVLPHELKDYDFAKADELMIEELAKLDF